MNRKALEEKRVDLVNQLQEIIDTAKAEKRELTEAEANNFANYETEIKNIDETIEREDKNMNKNEQRSAVEIRESEQFVNHIRAIVENRADSNLTAGNNGAIIPKTIAKKIITTAYDMCSILKDATKYNTKGALSIPVYGADGSTDITMAYADEFAELESKVGKFTSVDLGNFLAGCLAKLSKSLIANTDIDLENTVVNLVAEAVARFMEHECLVGTDGKVQGLRGVSLIVTAASASAITVEELVKLKNKVKKSFRKGAKWIMSNDTLTLIECLKDGDDRLVFHNDMSGEYDGYLLGYPVEVSDNMPDIATKTAVIYFGNFSGLALKQRDDALELQVLREAFATQHAIGVNAWIEFDAKVENAQKIAKLTMA
jgi:HK97 family phage major capsid protein